MRNAPIQLTLRKHPIDNRQTEQVEVSYRRQRLSTLIAQYMGQFNHVTVIRHGAVMSDDQVKAYRPQPGDDLVMMPTLRDPATIGAWFVSTALPAIVQAAVSAAIAYSAYWAAGELGLLPGQDSPKIGGSGSQAYSWNPQTLQRPNIPVPVAYGSNRLNGNLIDSCTEVAWINETEGATGGVSGGGECGADGLTRKILVAFCEGPTGGFDEDSILINDKPISSYSNVNYEYLDGTYLQAGSSIFDQTKLEYWLREPLTYSDGAYTYTTSDQIDDVKVVIKSQILHITPSGEWNWNSSGGVTIKIEISGKDAASWSTLVEDKINGHSRYDRYHEFIASETYTGGSPVTITRGTAYDVKITRTSADIDPADHENRLYGYTWLEYVQEIIDTQFNHRGLACIAVEALADEELSGSINISAVNTGKIIKNVTSGTLSTSSNPADVIYDMITQPLIDGDGDGTAWSIDSYRGIDPGDLPSSFTTELQALRTRAAETVSDGDGGTVARYTFNGVFDTFSNIWDAVKRVCKSCDCDLRPFGNGYKLYIDEPYSGTPTALFSSGNIIKDSYEETELDAIDKPAEFSMSIKDAELDYEDNTLYHYESDLNNASLDTSIDGFGITSYVQAARAIYREALRTAQINWVCKLKVGAPAMTCDLFDVVYIAAPWRRDGRVKSYTSGPTVTLDKAPDTTTGDDSLILITHNSATGDDAVEVIGVSSTSGAVITLDNTPTVAPVAFETVYAYGTTADVVKEWRVTGIKGEQHNQYTLTCEEYFDALYPADNWDPDLPYSGYADNPARVSSRTKPTLHELQSYSPTQDTITQETVSEYMATIEEGATNNSEWESDDNPSLIDVLKILLDAVSDFNVPLGEFTSGTLTGLVIQTANSGRRAVLDSNGLRLMLPTGTAGVYGTGVYGTATYGPNELAKLNNSATGIPVEIVAEQTVADFHYYNRSATPTGAATVGDSCVVSGVQYTCTSAGTPGTWTKVGTQT